LKSPTTNGEVGILQEVGGQIRNHIKGSSARLRSVSGCLRGEEHRCLRHRATHGSAGYAWAPRCGYQPPIIAGLLNGNDAVLVRQNMGWLRSREEKPVRCQKTVSAISHSSARWPIQTAESQIKRVVEVVNTSDFFSDIAGAFLQRLQTKRRGDPSMVSQIARGKDVKVRLQLFQIPGELLQIARSNPHRSSHTGPTGSGQKFAKAITGAWYD